jgi:hypothetical protein
MLLYMHDWILRGQATALLGSWPDSSFCPAESPLHLAFAGRDFGLRRGTHHHRPQHQGGGRHHHQVVTTGVA